MSDSRIWNLRLNIDELNAGCGGLSDDQEMADFMRGFIRGVNAGTHKMGTDNFQSGFAIGKRMRDEADELHSKAVSDGLKGGPKTWRKGGKPTPPNTPPNTPGQAILTGGVEGGVLAYPLILNPLIPTSPIQEEEVATATSKKKPKKEPPAFPDEVKEAARGVAKASPETDPQGRAIKINPAILLERLSTCFKENDWLTPDLAIGAWTEYLRTSPEWVKASHYFFGREQDQKGGAHWYAYAHALWNRQARAKQQQPILLEVM